MVSNRGAPNRSEEGGGSESVTDVTALVVWKSSSDCVEWSTCGGFVVDG